MSKKQGWTLSGLKHRGWTPELAAQLLPEPHVDPARPNRQYWLWKEVFQAEKSKTFQKVRRAWKEQRAQQEKENQEVPADGAALKVAEFPDGNGRQRPPKQGAEARAGRRDAQAGGQGNRKVEERAAAAAVGQKAGQDGRRQPESGGSGSNSSSGSNSGRVGGNGSGSGSSGSGNENGNGSGQQQAGEGVRKERKPRRIIPSRNVAGCLNASWSNVEKEDTPQWRLGNLYHRAILDRMAKTPSAPSRRIKSWLGEFLSLERDPLYRGARETIHRLVNLTRSREWLAENVHAPITARVYQAYGGIVMSLAEAVLQRFSQDRPGTDPGAALERKDFPIQMLLQEDFTTVWSIWYVPIAIRSSLSALVALDPKDEYPEARAMRRRFVLHIGGTNTGKTYDCFQQLIRAKTGVYLGPLRLLALEAQEYLLGAGVACGLVTGEEEDWREGDTHVASTAEKLELGTRYDLAVIDECQMIADKQRGYAWTRAILGVQAPEVHLCAAPEAEHLLVELVQSCGDSCQVVRHERKVPLICMSRNMDFQKVQPGDALITFSKIGVLSVAEDLRQSGKEPAIIYGALPYGARRRQMEGFLNGEMQYVVSTDAIGMGLNLPIRRVIFMETEKFDGVENRELKPTEIRQIAGRAGRYGMYSKGYVGATHNIHLIQQGLSVVVPPLTRAVLGFTDMVLRADFDLLEVLQEWSNMPTIKPFEKMDVSRYIRIITRMRQEGFHMEKDAELRAANIPFDETDPELMQLFFRYLECYQGGLNAEQPGYPEDNPTLPEMEQYCRKLDLYFSASRAFGFVVDLDHIQDCRERAAEEINEILVHRLVSNIRFCAECGKPLPIHYPYRVCQNCYTAGKRGRH